MITPRDGNFQILRPPPSVGHDLLGFGMTPPPRRVAVQTAANAAHDRSAEETDSENGYGDNTADSAGGQLARVVAAREDAVDGKIEGIGDDFFGVGVRWEGDISGSRHKFAGTFPV